MEPTIYHWISGMGTLHTLVWPHTNTDRWYCDCGGRKDEKHCPAVDGLKHSLGTMSDRVYNEKGIAYQDLFVSQGKVVDSDG